MDISCCMIVKNEASVLDNTLFLAKPIFDEIIIVDTGSVDDTVNIAKKYTDKVYFFSWNNNFSDARNFSISKAKNEWVFILDADEEIIEFDKYKITDLIKNERDIGRAVRRNALDNEQVYIERIKRLFNRNAFHFVGAIHEQVVARDRIEGNCFDISIKMNHIGYVNEVLKRTNKVDRNIDLLKSALKNDPRDPYLNYQLGKSFSLKKDLKSARISFEKAIQLVEDVRYEYVEDLIESYGYTLLNQGLYREALKIEKYLNIYRNQADFCFLMALIYMNNARFDKAIEWFKTCLAAKEGNIEGINSYLPSFNIAAIYECLGHTDEALSWYSKCAGYKKAEERMIKLGGAL